MVAKASTASEIRKIHQLKSTLNRMHVKQCSILHIYMAFFHWVGLFHIYTIYILFMGADTGCFRYQYTNFGNANLDLRKFNPY